MRPDDTRAEELLVAALDRRLQEFLHRLAERAIDAQLARQRRRADAVDLHADLVPSDLSTVGMTAKMPMEPVIVAGLAQISSAGAAM